VLRPRTDNFHWEIVEHLSMHLYWHVFRLFITRTQHIIVAHSPRVNFVAYLIVGVAKVAPGCYIGDLLVGERVQHLYGRVEMSGAFEVRL